MHLYPGTNPFTAPTPTVGYGLWPTPDVVNGGDRRNAMNLMVAIESLTDRSNWEGHRSLNPIEGVDMPFTAPIRTNNQWIYDGSGEYTFGSFLYLKGAAFVTGSSTLYIGHASLGAGHLVVRTNGDITIQDDGEFIAEKGALLDISCPVTLQAVGVTSNAQLVCEAGVPAVFYGESTFNDLATFNGGMQLDCGINRTGNLLNFGPDAKTFHRSTQMSGSSSTFDPTDFDIVYTTSPGANITKRLAKPANFTRKQFCRITKQDWGGGSTFTITIVDDDTSNPLCEFVYNATQNNSFVDLVWDPDAPTTGQWGIAALHRWDASSLPSL